LSAYEQQDEQNKTDTDCSGVGRGTRQRWAKSEKLIQFPKIKTSDPTSLQILESGSEVCRSGVQESTPAGVSVFQQDRSRIRSGYFLLKQEPEQEWFFSQWFWNFNGCLQWT